MATNPHLSTPASDEPEYEIDSFELLWEQHKGKIIAGIAAVLAIGLGVGGWFAFTTSRNAAAVAALSSARTTADYEAVMANYGFSPVSGDAALLLAGNLRAEKKYDAANDTLRRFVERQPEHPLAPVAKVAQAENLALMGKTDEAVKALKALAQTDAASFVAPYALNVAAELASSQGKREEALKTYRELAQTFPNSVAAQVSKPAAQALEMVLGSAPQ